jgi:hypothetical protein
MKNDEQKKVNENPVGHFVYGKVMLVCHYYYYRIEIIVLG